MPRRKESTLLSYFSTKSQRSDPFSSPVVVKKKKKRRVEEDFDNDSNGEPVSSSGSATTSEGESSKASVKDDYCDCESIEKQFNALRQMNKPAPGNKRQKKQKEQVYLDFGQASFGKQIICPICNFMYVHGVKDDEAQHKKICTEYTRGVLFQGWKNEKVVQTFDGDRKERIIQIRSSDPSHHLAKVAHLKSIVDTEMSFSPAKIPKDLTHFLYISSKKRILGYVSVHPISFAYPLLNKSTRSTKKQKAILGVFQIWTHSSGRRKGIAKKLVDIARDKMIFGMYVEKQNVAFSSPTADGMNFAESYLGEDSHLLVYDCI